jgi:hypothetical protein
VFILEAAQSRGHHAASAQVANRFAMVGSLDYWQLSDCGAET